MTNLPAVFQVERNATPGPTTWLPYTLELATAPAFPFTGVTLPWFTGPFAAPASRLPSMTATSHCSKMQISPHGSPARTLQWLPRVQILSEVCAHLSGVFSYQFQVSLHNCPSHLSPVPTGQPSSPAQTIP